MVASHRFLVHGAFPLGALLGGWLGGALGLRSAIALCAVAGRIPPPWVACSPLRHLRDQPTGTTV